PSRPPGRRAAVGPGRRRGGGPRRGRLAQGPARAGRRRAARRRTRRSATTEARVEPAATPGRPDIVCEDLVRVFATDGVEVQALQGLNLRVDAGDLVAVVGASGSGKSTLLTILSGLDRPTAGSAVVAGVDLLTMTAAQRTAYQRDVVGFVWQQTGRNLLPYLTAGENVALPLIVARRVRGRRRRAQRVAELLDLMGVGDLRDRLPRE